MPEYTNAERAKKPRTMRSRRSRKTRRTDEPRKIPSLRSSIAPQIRRQSRGHVSVLETFGGADDEFGGHYIFDDDRVDMDSINEFIAEKDAT